ncbi:MAG TPA: TolC family protein, partial [Nitrospiraceae bacterium]|nr:TolC family protein [Nitrospiraceae bacterium]
MRVVIALVCLLMPGMAWSSGKNDVFTLDEVIAYGMENSAVVRSAQADVAAESTGVRAAEAARMPKFDLQGGVTKYSFPSPVTPIAGSPTAGLAFPEFDRTIYNAGLTFNLPLFQGGRLIRGVTIAKLRRSIAEDTFLMSRQDLIYNLTSTYYKILQLDKMLQAHEASVRQL